MSKVFLADNVMLSISQGGNGQLVYMLINLKIHGIFRSNFA